jgi:hypothetical protein
MPNVGDILANVFRVEYVNYGKFKITASYKTIPPKQGDSIKIEDRLFEIDRIDVAKKRFGLTFKGFDEPMKPVPDAPEIEDTENTVKLI